jgi:hypothetical protein
MDRISGFRESDRLRFMRVPMAKYAAQGVLDTRSRGAEVRWDIERSVAASCDGEALVIDFDHVRAVTVPFVEECIGKLLAGRSISYYDDHPVLAVNANDDVRDTLAVALGNRRLALLHASEPPMLLGGDDILNATLREAWPMRRFTASDVAERLGISTQAANNRLKALVARGALHRVLTVPAGGGKEFAYTVPEPGASTSMSVPKQAVRRRRSAPRPTHV